MPSVRRFALVVLVAAAPFTATACSSGEDTLDREGFARELQAAGWEVGAQAYDTAVLMCRSGDRTAADSMARLAAVTRDEGKPALPADAVERYVNAVFRTCEN